MTLLIQRDKSNTIDHILKLITAPVVPLTKLCVFFYSLLLANLEAFGCRGLEIIIPLVSHSLKLQEMMILD